MMAATTILVLGLAQAAAPKGAEPREAFAPMAFLAGSCWMGTFPDGKARDEHCFEWVYEGKFLRDRHVVTGARAPYGGETLYAWDPDKKKVVYWYWTSQGAFSTGEVEFEPGEVVFPERHVSEAGVRELRSVWRRTGEDRYRVSTAERADGAWKELWSMEMVRRGPSDRR